MSLSEVTSQSHVMGLLRMPVQHAVACLLEQPAPDARAMSPHAAVRDGPAPRPDRPDSGPSGSAFHGAAHSGGARGRGLRPNHIPRRNRTRPEERPVLLQEAQEEQGFPVDAYVLLSLCHGRKMRRQVVTRVTATLPRSDVIVSSCTS